MCLTYIEYVPIAMNFYDGKMAKCLKKTHASWPPKRLHPRFDVSMVFSPPHPTKKNIPYEATARGWFIALFLRPSGSMPASATQRTARQSGNLTISELASVVLGLRTGLFRPAFPNIPKLKGCVLKSTAGSTVCRSNVQCMNPLASGISLSTAGMTSHAPRKLLQTAPVEPKQARARNMPNHMTLFRFSFPCSIHCSSVEQGHANPNDLVQPQQEHARPQVDGMPFQQVACGTLAEQFQFGGKNCSAVCSGV